MPLPFSSWTGYAPSSEGRDPETSGREGLYDLACAFAMLESSTLKRQVTLMEVLSGAANAYQAEIDAFYGLGVRTYVRKGFVLCAACCVRFCAESKAYPRRY
jgi:hypothetical protein